MTVDNSSAAIAGLIDHSLLQPFLDDASIQAGLELARDLKVAAACVKPYSIPQSVAVLQGSGVQVCAVIGFPHGNSTTGIKVVEAEAAALAGATEIDMVVNVGKVKGGQWDYVAREIRLINEAVVGAGSILKVIFENDFLVDAEVIRLCEICSEARVAFVKTSTGYGFVKTESGLYTYAGATVERIRLMRKHTAPEIQIKAAGGVGTLDALLAVRDAGASRIGASATAAIVAEARARFG